jgi:phosphatidyl-myo-inositol alpha-mannosyltransferase
MKIAFVLDDSLDKTDGVQQYVLTLGKWFKSQGHDVHYIVGQTERTDIPNIHSLSRNVQVHFNQNRLSTPLPASKKRIRLLLEQENFDVLHVQLPHSPFLAARVINAASPATAIIGTFHIIPFSSLETTATFLLGAVLRRNLKKFDRIYSVSKPAAYFAKRSFNISTSILPNAVDINFFHSARAIKKYDDGFINIVFLGRLVERKGCRYLLEAIERLHRQQRLEGVRVLICGKGPLQPSLEEYVKSRHLKKVVHFTGYVSELDKARYLKTAHIAAFPSTGGESFGIVLLEAMAAGSEVVLGGDNIGYRSVLGGQPDQLVAPVNVNDFARTLDHFIANARARRIAKKWQDKVIVQYDVRVIGKKLLGDYQTALHHAKEMR